MERILANLVENALGAVRSPGGRVLVEAYRVRDGAGRAAVALRVSDDGRGFPPGSLDRVFDRFYRADPARSGPGSGLGLAIVRALARAHGGDATAENLAPTGARVTVTLPVVPPRLRRQGSPRSPRRPDVVRTRVGPRRAGRPQQQSPRRRSPVAQRRAS